MSVTYYAARKMKVGGVWVEPGDVIDVTGYRQGAVAALLQKGDISTTTVPAPSESNKWDVLRSSGDVLEYSSDGYVDEDEFDVELVTLTVPTIDDSWFGTGMNVHVIEVTKPVDTWVDVYATRDVEGEVTILEGNPLVPGETAYGDPFFYIGGQTKWKYFFPANQTRYVCINHWNWDTDEHVLDIGPLVASIESNKSRIQQLHETYSSLNTVTGEFSSVSGIASTASGFISHAEGSKSTASGRTSHAEGDTTTASGGASHSEGQSTTASGGEAHAEGHGTKAEGRYSHAQNKFTRAEAVTSTSLGEASHAKIQTAVALAGGAGGTGSLWGVYGNAQAQFFVMRGYDNLPLDTGYTQTRGQPQLTDGFVHLFSVRMISKDSTGAEVKAWDLKAAISTVTGTPSILGTLSKTVIAETAGASTWDVTVDVTATRYVQVEPVNLPSGARTVAMVELLEIGPDGHKP